MAGEPTCVAGGGYPSASGRKSLQQPQRASPPRNEGYGCGQWVPLAPSSQQLLSLPKIGRLPWKRQPSSVAELRSKKRRGEEGGYVSLCEQVAGHKGSFVRVREDTVCKELDEAELAAYNKIVEDGILVPFVPRCLGVQDLNGTKYLELEDMLQGFQYEKSGLIDLKIGYTTFRADTEGATKPKADYYAKGAKIYKDLLTPEEHAMGKISKARWMTLNNMQSSTAVHGFRIDGFRLGDCVLELGQESKTLEVFSDVLCLVPLQVLQNIYEELSKLLMTLPKSELFMTHNLYGSSILVAFNETAQVRVKVIDVRHLTPRGERRFHTVRPEDLPLPCESTEDGYLTALANLLNCILHVITERQQQWFRGS
eukprot:TRINITY_DN32372_c0_g1_i1.p1 TRINITY_DN32372_c0_g1~~TRINITY_DN32372_c0_g1_i1.p1  ORF type:complete len:415 (+),score=91.28 TRINITY_DN32372_c0_g1_i1:144-1247(+)